MSNDSEPTRPIDKLSEEGAVHLVESPVEDRIYVPAAFTGSEEFGRLFCAAFVLMVIGERAYLHDIYRAMLAASDDLNFDGDLPPENIRRSDAQVLRDVADIRDPDEPDTWDDFEGG